jgi:hypothetical protein
MKSFHDETRGDETKRNTMSDDQSEPEMIGQTIMFTQESPPSPIKGMSPDICLGV